jgi:NAD(P)H dehydrogenase (quinone)
MWSEEKEVNTKILIVYAHPNPQSFNHAILEVFTSGLSESGHTYEVVDLYAIRFKPCLDGGDLAKLTAGKTPEDIRAQQDKVSRAEGIVFIHPVWWTGAPAILKGWVDRVFSMGFAYTFEEKTGHPVGLLKHKKGLVINTAGAGEEDAEASGMTKTINRAEVEGVLKFCGVREAHHVIFYNVIMTDDETRRRYLEEAKRLGKTFL